MTVEFHIDEAIPDTVHFIIKGLWHWHELIESIEAALTPHLAGETLRLRFDAIITLDDGNYLPPDALNHLKTISRLIRDHGGVVVLVGARRLPQTMLGVLRRIMPEIDVWHTAASLDEARNKILDARGNINNS